MSVRVMHIYKDFDTYNGLSEIMLLLAQRLSRRFVLELCVFRYRGSPFGREFERLGGRIHSLDVAEGLLGNAAELAGLIRWLRRERPDIVQTHVLKSNLYGIVAARLAGVPKIIATEMTLKDTAQTPARRMRDRLLHPLLGRVLGLADRFMVTSEHIRRQWGDHDGKVRVIYPFFNEAKLAAAGPRSRGSQKFRVGYVGRLSEEKGLGFLLEAYRRISSRSGGMELVVVGAGPQEAELRRRAADLGDGVVFAGFSSNVFCELKNMDLFVLPSRSEGASIALIEAMAAGLPAVATRVGGSPELIEDGVTGLLVPFGDEEALAEAIAWVRANPEAACGLGRRARAVAWERFGPDNFVRQIEALYDEVLAQPGASRSRRPGPGER